MQASQASLLLAPMALLHLPTEHGVQAWLPAKSSWGCKDDARYKWYKPQTCPLKLLSHLAHIPTGHANLTPGQYMAAATCDFSVSSLKKPQSSSLNVPAGHGAQTMPLGGQVERLFRVYSLGLGLGFRVCTKRSTCEKSMGSSNCHCAFQEFTFRTDTGGITCGTLLMHHSVLD